MSPLDSGRMEDQMKPGYGGEDEGVLELDGDDVSVRNHGSGIGR